MSLQGRVSECPGCFFQMLLLGSHSRSAEADPIRREGPSPGALPQMSLPLSLLPILITSPPGGLQWPWRLREAAAAYRNSGSSFAGPVGLAELRFGDWPQVTQPVRGDEAGKQKNFRG